MKVSDTTKVFNVLVSVRAIIMIESNYNLQIYTLCCASGYMDLKCSSLCYSFQMLLTNCFVSFLNVPPCVVLFNPFTNPLRLLSIISLLFYHIDMLYYLSDHTELMIIIRSNPFQSDPLTCIRSTPLYPILLVSDLTCIRSLYLYPILLVSDPTLQCHVHTLNMII